MLSASPDRGADFRDAAGDAAFQRASSNVVRARESDRRLGTELRHVVDSEPVTQSV
ncbi:MAG TPA: hypothetical protein VGO18_10680 [Steroidobacteraceae bacterium]|nr:hypothetical protein [Steroidobacteraceae bacterium]